MNKKLTFIAIVLAYFAYRFTIGNSNKVSVKIYGKTIETLNGPVRGTISKSRDGHEFYEYRGIPYAKAGRFEIPKPLTDKWEGVRDASEFGAKCLQFGLLIGNIDGEEDCLFLNVFVPKRKVSASKLPVLVFIHGGHFTEGSSNRHLADFLIDEDVVVVTINYRLGVLGFLNTGDGLVRGNMGLKDQNMALQWVQKNIESFGGDKTKVTISGESAGSVSVHHHVLSLMSKGLFSKAISMSGISLHPWAFMPTPKEQAIRFGQRVKCPTSTTAELVSCLKAKEAYELVAAQNDILVFPRNQLAMFLPSIEAVVDENTFLKEKPVQILAKGSFNKVPFLAGVNSHEGLIISSSLVSVVGALDQLETDSESIFPQVILSSPNDKKMRKIRSQYFGVGNSINTFDQYDNYTKLISDRHFFSGFESMVHLQSKHTSIYTYYYTYASEFSFTPILLSVKGRFPRLLELLISSLWNSMMKNIFGIKQPRYGTCHADELSLFFNMPGLSNVHSEHQDYEFSKKVISLWTNFIKDENSLEFMGHSWKPVQANDKHFKYLHIDEDSAGLIVPPFRERLKFWEELDLQ